MPSSDIPSPDEARSPTPEAAHAAPPASPPQWTSESLLRGGREALIEHVGAIYRLRLTSSGKLILTK
jgi:hemin uptake protein HemP